MMIISNPTFYENRPIRLIRPGQIAILIFERITRLEAMQVKDL